jgi:hypothetical protein
VASPSDVARSRLLRGGIPKVFNNKFGIEAEFTGITRAEAAKVAAGYFGVELRATHDSYDTYIVRAQDGRLWKFVSDASIDCQRKNGRQTVSANRDYSVELVSPILSYREDIKTVQELVRRLRKAKGFANKSCGIHVHLDGSNHTVRSIRNFVNIVASKNDLFYKALQIELERMRYCKKMDAYLVERMNRQKPQTFQQIQSIWYQGYHGSQSAHYHESRYHFLNLHSFFTGNHTVELRGFNSELHAGKIRAYIVLALALNHQALTQKSASSRKSQEENEKFAMRVYLNRIGFIGDEYKSCREHLYRHLSGNAAWRYGHDLRLDRRQEGGESNL